MNDINSLIVVKQLPVIEQQLLMVKQKIESRVQEALSLECTVETVKDIKKVRAELNKEFKEFEMRRKAVKELIMKPYDEFDRYYKDCITEQYKKADIQIRDRIASVESSLLSDKYDKIKAYYDECVKSVGLEWIPFEIALPSITLSASVKSLQKTVKEFIDKVNSDIKLIHTMQNSDEIMVEYKKNYDVSLSTQIVLERKAEIENEKQFAIQAEQREIANNQVIKKVEETVEETEPLTAPAVVKEVQSEPEYPCRFKVTGTIAQLKALKEYMIAENLKFETIKEHGNE